jgi:L-threonate 2-dehydrogenase
MTTPSIPQVGLIGLGAMGNGMAQSLRRAGYSPHVFDIRADISTAFAKDGGTVCYSLAELGSSCDVIVSVVVNAAQTESVLFGKDGCAATMKPGSVFVMCSTVDPNWSVALEAKLDALEILYIDAPISGGAAKAASGQMTMMTAGKPEAYAKAGRQRRCGQQGQNHQSITRGRAHRSRSRSHGFGLARRC